MAKRSITSHGTPHHTELIKYNNNTGNREEEFC